MSLRLEISEAVWTTFTFVCIVWAVVYPAYLSMRPFLARAGWVPVSGYDLEIYGWYAERAGDIGVAVDWYRRALEMDPGNRALRQKLAGMTGREPPPESPDYATTLMYLYRTKGQETLRGVVGVELVGLPGEVWDVAEDQFTGRVVALAHGVEVARASPAGAGVGFTWTGGGGGFDDAVRYLAAAIRRAVPPAPSGRSPAVAPHDASDPTPEELAARFARRHRATVRRMHLRSLPPEAARLLSGGREVGYPEYYAPDTEAARQWQQALYAVWRLARYGIKS